MRERQASASVLTLTCVSCALKHCDECWKHRCTLCPCVQCLDVSMSVCAHLVRTLSLDILIGLESSHMGSVPARYKDRERKRAKEKKKKEKKSKSFIQSVDSLTHHKSLFSPSQLNLQCHRWLTSPRERERESESEDTRLHLKSLNEKRERTQFLARVRSSFYLSLVSTLKSTRMSFLLPLLHPLCRLHLSFSCTFLFQRFTDWIQA